ncbi:hypothetical protein M2350_003337 [Candidatus Fervidibacter sacchari]|uniref:Uncharacterized protein n=1 Tax=Candidatus Fervidibacter sacchari TaxID=1448929 RepID=A0ABT2ESF6_9BACT|nr:hypothetical protein [Candidatus Fervidibacter sacchari]
MCRKPFGDEIEWGIWEGEAPAEPKTTANGDWRIAIGE